MYLKRLSQLIFVIAVLIFASFYAFYRLGVREIESADEGIYGQVSLEIFNGGSLIEPTWYDSIWLEKPPLHLWINQLAIAVFGPVPFAIRFFPALFFLACGAMMAVISYRLWKNVSGALAFLLFTVSTLFIVEHIGRTGDFDMALIFFSLIAVYSYIRQLENREGKWWLLSGLALAGGFWVKSAMIAPVFLAFFLHWLISFRNKEQLLTLLKIYATSALCILPWVILNLIFFKQEFITFFWEHQILDRMSPNFTHLHPWYWYGEFLHWSLAPFIYLAIVSLILFFKRWKSLSTSEQILPLWFLAVFVPFSIVSSKLYWHVLPAVIPLLLIVAQTVWRMPRERMWVRVLLPISLTLGYYPIVFSNGYWYFGELKKFHLGYMTLIAFVILLGWFVLRRMSIRQHFVQGAFYALLIASILFNVQRFKHLILYPTPSLLELSLEFVQEKDFIYLYQFSLMQLHTGAYPEPSVMFYLLAKQLDYSVLNSVEEFEQLPPGSLVLVKIDEIAFSAPADLEVLSRTKEYLLIRR